MVQGHRDKGRPGAILAGVVAVGVVAAATVLAGCEADPRAAYAVPSRSSYDGLLADGQAKYVRDVEGTPVGLVVVAWPAPGKGGAAVMKAALDRQGQQAAEHDGTTGVKEVAGHDVLEFDDSSRQPNWYWVSGDEFVMVTGHDYHAGAAFVAALAAETR